VEVQKTITHTFQRTITVVTPEDLRSVSASYMFGDAHN
jgi:hypothetical protein